MELRVPYSEHSDAAELAAKYMNSGKSVPDENTLRITLMGCEHVRQSGYAKTIQHALNERRLRGFQCSQFPVAFESATRAPS